MKKKLLAILSMVLAFAMPITAAGCAFINGTGNSSSENVESSSVSSNENSSVSSNENSSGNNGNNGGDKDDETKVLLVSLDGLRADAFAASEYCTELREMGCYSLKAQTVNPSVTLPAHMSMFHSVSPETHEIKSNTYFSNPNRGNGITETLTEAGKTCAMFYDWEQLQNLTTATDEVEQLYITGSPSYGKEWFEESTVSLTDACIEHIQNTPTDFTFLYYALTDQMGHTYGWLSNKYYWGIDYVFGHLKRVLNALPDNYVTIITSDHGGGGGNGATNHGSGYEVDMTIPFFIIGEGFEEGKVLDYVSILDVAPTVAELLGVEAEEYWVGRSFASIGSDTATAEEKAWSIFSSRSSYVDVHRGMITSFERTENTVTVGGAVNTAMAGNTFSGFGISLSAIQAWLDLGYKYITFTVGLTADEGVTAPTHVYIYDYYEKKYKDVYYANNSTITIDLEAVSEVIPTTNPYLIFIFTKDGSWTATGAKGYLTFSNVSFSAE